MIPKSNKFPARTEFLTLRAKAKQNSSTHLRLMHEFRHAKNSVIVDGGRLSVVVPLKVSKKAVVRNHFKRLAYDALWKAFSKVNLDCVVIFKPIALIKSKEVDVQIVSELEQLISEITLSEK